MWCHTLSSSLAQAGWEQDWRTVHLQTFISISSNVYLLTCVILSVIPTMSASTAVSCQRGSEAFFSFPSQSTPGVEVCVFALTWAPWKNPADVLNSMKGVALVTVKYHTEKNSAEITLLKNWVKNLNSEKTKLNQNTQTPNPSKTLRGEKQKKIVSVKQSSARIFHGWRARTICQAVFKDFAQGSWYHQRSE